MDVAINGQAVFVERLHRKPIMSSFHAMFSIGMALGAGACALFTKFEIFLWEHLLLVGVLGRIAQLLVIRFLVHDQPEKTRVVVATTIGYTGFFVGPPVTGFFLIFTD